MKKSLLTLFIFFSLFSGAQNPLVKMWDRGFGGTSIDQLTSIQQTADGGYILGGGSVSGIGGDKTQATWGSGDCWIVKTDSLGNKQWDKDFGGTNDDGLNSIQQTADGGFILGGSSFSGIGGDKTQATRGSGDYWIVKTDSLGNKQWDKDFGGTDLDVLFSIQQTADGGFILGGYSSSGIGGDKTQPLRGGWADVDYWIVKTDSLGNKEWDKDIGGTNTDFLFSVQQTSDKGYILGGYSESGIGGDKTQALWGGSGDIDYWIVKTDSLGNKQWDRDFGGIDDDWLLSIRQTADGGYILGGESYSGISGDKTQASRGLKDYWIIKTDSLGNKQWNKDFGGPDNEWLKSIRQTADGGYILGGYSNSWIGGDKTQATWGGQDYWIVKTDSLGNKQWDKDCGGTDDDRLYSLQQTAEGGYILGGYSGSGIGGDKTQASRGSQDYWLIKFCDTTGAIPIIALTSLPKQNICPNTCVDFVNLTPNGINYIWSFPGAIPDTSTVTNPTNICYPMTGSYDVQLIATNANGTDTLLLTNYITVYPAPPPQSITQSGDTLFAIAGATGYQWYFNTTIINGATDYFYVAPSSGDYNVVATDGNGCEVEAAVFNVLASAQAAVGSSSMQVFPNPTHDKVTIQKSQVTSGTAIEISIYNMMGEIIRNRYTDSRSKNQELTIDVSQLPPGMYWLEIKSGAKIFRSKFIKAGNR